MKKKSQSEKLNEISNPDKWIHFETIPGFVGDERERLLAVNRAKVPGGWLIYIFGHTEGGLDPWRYGGLTFYPDPEHEWDGLSLPIYDVSRISRD